MEESSKKQNKLPQILILIAAVILALVLYILCIPYFFDTKDRAPLTACYGNLSNIKYVMEEIYKERKENGKIEAHYEKDDEYWWLKASINKGWLKKEPTPMIYCPDDSEQKKYPSSYIANPKLNVIDIEKVPHRDRKILLMEREPFHKEYFKLYGEPFYHCIMADFQFKRIPKSKINLYKDW